MQFHKNIRNKRFSILKPEKVILVFESKVAINYQLEVVDVSLTGLSVRSQKRLEELESLTNEIFPASKIKVDESEHTLGRLVLRRIATHENLFYYAFSLVDGKVPIESAFKGYIDSKSSSDKSYLDYELNPDKFTLADFAASEFKNSDLLEKCQRFDVFYKDWEKTEKFAYLIPRTESFGPRVNLSKTRENKRKDFLMLGSNDYLGFASRREIKEAAKDAIDKYGFGSTGTPHTSGTTDLHEELCQRVAKMFKKDSAMIYASGYSTNVGIISGIARENDLLVADIISHASMQDGMNMSKAATRYFKHNDMDHLRKILDEHRSNYAGCLILTEGVFSMDGTIGELEEISKISKEYNCRIFVDHGHDLGVLGDKGYGAGEHTGTMKNIDLAMGLFSKGLGGVGGFIAADEHVIQWLKMFSRSYIFATTVPPVCAAATLKALDLLDKEKPFLTLRENVKHFISGLNGLGAKIDINHQTPIVPIVIGDEKKLGIMFKSMFNDGIFVVPVIYPIVSRSRCRFRFSLRADLTISDLDYVLSCFEKAMKKAEFTFDQVDPSWNPIGDKRFHTVKKEAA